MSPSRCASLPVYYSTKKEEPSCPFSATMSALKSASPAEFKAFLKAINDQLPRAQPRQLPPQTQDQIRRDMTRWIMGLEWEHGIKLPNPYKRPDEQRAESNTLKQMEEEPPKDDWLKGRVLKSVPFPLPKEPASCGAKGKVHKRPKQAQQHGFPVRGQRRFHPTKVVDLSRNR